MKKITLFALSLLASASMLATAQVTEPTTLWANAFTDLKAGGTTQGSGIALASDGGVYAIGGFGTTVEGDSIKWGSENVAPGTLCNTTSTSGNQTFMLSKIDKSGNLTWRVYTENAEVANNESWVAGTPDGVVAFFDIRHASGFEDKNIVFVDGNDNKTTLEWNLGAAGTARYYYGIILKVNNDGELQWIRHIKMNHDGQPNASSNYKDNTGQGIYSYAVTTDAAGNIFIAGNMRTTMTVTKADGSELNIEPHNVADWTGDPQTSCGNLYIIKFDKNGNYLNHLVSAGAAKHEVIRALQAGNNNLYFFGIATGTGNDAIILGDKEVTPANAFGGILAGAVSLDLSEVKWLSYYDNTKSGGTMQTPGMRVYGDNMWIMGKSNMQGFVAGNKTLSCTHTRDALLLKVNATNGELTDGYVKLVNQAGYFDCIEANDGALYVAGHSLLGPVVLDKFDKEDLTDPAQSWSLASRSSDTQGIEMTEDGTLYVMFRSNSNTTFLNSDITVGPLSKFGCIVAGYEMPIKQVPTAIQGVDAVKTVTAVRYYNLAGVESATPFQGVNIRVETYSDGSRTATKIIK